MTTQNPTQTETTETQSAPTVVQGQFLARREVYARAEAEATRRAREAKTAGLRRSNVPISIWK